MNILVTLNSGLGADTGPNFNLTTDVGSVTPNTATKSELLAGKFVDVDPSATQITVTSVGTCTTSIVLNIVGQTTTTTTSAASSFSLGYDVSNFFAACVDYGVSPTTVYSTTGATLAPGLVLYSNSSLSAFAVDGFYSNGTNWWRVNFGEGIIVSTGSCTTTTSTTSTTSTSTSTSTTSTTSTSTTTTLAPVVVNLGYDATVGWQACYATQSPYYISGESTLQNGTFIYTDSTLSTTPADGYYSNGANYWNVISGELFDETPCPTTSTTSTTSTSTSTTSTTSTSTSTSTTTEAPTTTTTTAAPTTTTTTAAPTTTTTTVGTTTSTTTLPGDTTTTSTTTTAAPTTTTTTAAPTTTTTTVGTTTSTTTLPGDTTTTSTTTTAAPTTTTTTAAPTSTTTTAAPTTTTTTIAPNSVLITPGSYAGTTSSCAATATLEVYYLGTLGDGITLYENSGLTTPFDGDGDFYKIGSNHVGRLNSFGTISSYTNCSTTTTTTTEPPTTTTTTTASGTVDIYITNSSLDVPIGSMTINGVNVDWVGSGPNFVIGASDNGSFTSNQFGTYDVVIGYGGHIPGQRITFYDSNNFATCQTLNGGVGTFTITGATITFGTTITVVVEDGICV